MTVNSNPKVKIVFANYPDSVKTKMNELRSIVIKQAKKDNISSLEETLKWGEPSYIAPKGSTIRMDWKAKNPNQYALFFNCSSKLIPTFRVLYPNVFTFENNRAIIFQLTDYVPKRELSHCISLALNYHNVKKLPLLGA